jgi:hypothetical protein
VRDDFEAKLNQLTAMVAAAYLRHNRLPLSSLPELIIGIRKAFGGKTHEFSQDLGETPPEATAAEPPPKASIGPRPPAWPGRLVALAVGAAAGVKPAAEFTRRHGRLALDRTAVLFIGVAVGCVVTGAFKAEAPRRPALVAKAAPASAAGGPVAPPTLAQPVMAIDCATPVPPRLLKALADGTPISVGVFGDSFGDGIWAALYHKLAKNSGYQLLKLSRESTGFTRYESLNLETQAANDLSTHPVDIAVIDFGANDTQGIYEQGHLYPLLSPGWKAVYGQRMVRFVNLLRNQGAMVYWVGMPKMRKPDYDQQIAGLNAFYAEQMALLDVPFLATAPLSVDADGQFNTYLNDPVTKQPQLMRANDGIHMSMAGYDRIAAPLISRITAYVDHSRALARLQAPPAAPGGVKVASVARPGINQ